MFKFNSSPSYWCALGILWSVSLLLLVVERGFRFSVAYIIVGLLAVLSYTAAIYLAIRRKKIKEDHYEKDS